MEIKKIDDNTIAITNPDTQYTMEFLQTQVSACVNAMAEIDRRIAREQAAKDAKASEMAKWQDLIAQAKSAGVMTQIDIAAVAASEAQV